jgi:ubiquinone/menaquinone biosynthesis C-methylase UbiE
VDTSLKVNFDRVDRTTDPAEFASYLDATRAIGLFQDVKRRSYALLDPRPGDCVCDVGCGTGDDVLTLARLVGPSGLAVGVDMSATMLSEARRRAAAAGIAAGFVQSDAQRLALPDAAFDCVRVERLLQHVHDPDAVLAQLVRVARPGARIVVWEADLDLFTIDAPDYEVSRAMHRFICDGFRHGRIGHELYRRFKGLGLADVQATPLVGTFTDLAFVERAFDLPATTQKAAAAGVVASERASAWLASLTAAAEIERFFCAAGGVLAFGRTLSRELPIPR